MAKGFIRQKLKGILRHKECKPQSRGGERKGEGEEPEVLQFRTGDIPVLLMVEI